MSGTVVGKQLNFGYPGTISRSVDAIVINRLSKGEITFGEPVVLNADNSISKFGESNVADDFVGVAVREVKQATEYATGKASYLDKERTDALVRGSVCVKINAGTATAGGKLHIRIKENSAIPDGVIGGFEAEADGLNTVELKGVRFTCGKIDSNKVAEITILERRI